MREPCCQTRDNQARGKRHKKQATRPLRVAACAREAQQAVPSRSLADGWRSSTRNTQCARAAWLHHEADMRALGGQEQNTSKAAGRRGQGWSICIDTVRTFERSKRGALWSRNRCR